MKKRLDQGFTLIEVIVVAGIIAILAGVLVPMILKEIDESRITRASADIRSLSSAILVFKKDTAEWPIQYDEGCSDATLLYGAGNAPAGLGDNSWDNDLTSSINNHLAANTDGCYNNWAGPYTAYVTADPWGNQYVINASGFTSATDAVWIMSAGPNGVLDTDAGELIIGATDDVGLRIK